MIKHYITSCLLLTLILPSFSQIAPPQAFSYSAIARDAQGNPLANQAIGIQISILKGSTVGPIQYQENHFATTSQLGLFTLIVGTGTIQQGTFGNIGWNNDSYYLKIGMDINGGTNFQTMGTTQFLSVPYALYAQNAGNLTYQALSLSNDTLYLSNGGKVYLGNYNNYFTPQTLSLNGDTLKISQGNQVILPSVNFTVKINDVAIDDPSINDVMVGPTTFLTETNYRYDLDTKSSYGGLGLLNDSIYLASPESGILSNLALYPSNNCNGQPYIAAIGGNGGVSRGRIFNLSGSVYYVPMNASPTILSNPWLGGCSQQLSGSYTCYPIFPNNAAVTGFGFSSSLLKVNFVRQ